MARETIVFFIAAIDIIADESSGWTSFGDFVAHIQQLGRTLQEAGPKGVLLLLLFLPLKSMGSHSIIGQNS